MKKHFLTAALAAAVISAGFLTADAAPCKVGERGKMPEQQMRQKPPQEEMKAMMEKRVEEFNKALNLSDSQVKQAKEIRAKGHAKMKPLMEKKRAKMDQIRLVMGNDDILVKEQDKQIDALRAEIKEIDQEIRQLRQDNEKEFKGILNDEQKVKYQQIKEDGRKYYRTHHSPQRPEAFRHHRDPHHGAYGPMTRPDPDCGLQPVQKPVKTK